MSKETVSGFNPENVSDLMSSFHKDAVNGYLHEFRKITSNDPEDGGASHYLVIKRISDDKYFHAEFTDWESEDSDNSLDIEFEECTPKHKTIIIYE